MSFHDKFIFTALLKIYYIILYRRGNKKVKGERGEGATHFLTVILDFLHCYFMT
jgi:hypothetical protein